ncbi:MAG TPA: hypothetical protein VEC01_04070 [Noviherbaspirillum sp.]|uniref:hypothetical protein n=1 Tax=Noviherbaspirillum sp. TaxID=1926288 RepID=UPI002D651086|nr:hypothetical protein [Noviherbaspirillum sp.]HYD94478.1 hypothetical protein [Noviherbaspirillum sp.]
MQIVIASDIHGTNDRLRALFARLGDRVVFLSPWESDGCPYQSEQEAVRVFHSADGLVRYERKIAMATAAMPSLLIGFSVGAASMWLHTANTLCHPHSQAFLYYGSRIREHRAISPRCPVSLVFAEHEASFQPEALANELSRPGITCSIIPRTSHGFMNPLSGNFNEELALQQIEHLKRVALERALP